MGESGARHFGAERIFTIELDSGGLLTKVSVPNGAHGVLLEGTIGVLVRARFVETNVLEIAGTGGVLRLDLAREDLAEPNPWGGEKR